MTVSPDEDYVQLVDDLSEVQRKLVKEDTLYEYIEKDTKETETKLELLTYRVRCIQKYIITFLSSTFRVKPSNYSLPYINSIFTYNINEPIPYELEPESLQSYYKVAKQCTDQIDILAQVAIKLQEVRPELTHNICNSTIPALFQNLYTRESIEQFHEFTKYIFSKFPGSANKFLNFLLMHPLTSQFVEALIEDIPVPYTHENYVSFLKKSWKRNAGIMPQFVVDIFADSPTPATILFDSIIKPIFQFPKMNRLIHQLDEIDEQRLAKLIEDIGAIKEKLWKRLTKSGPLCKFPREENNSQIRNISSFYVFSDDDLVILSYFSKYAKEMDLFDIPVDPPSTYNSILIFPDPVEPPQASMSSIVLYSSHLDDTEMNIRSLLVKLPPISHASSSSADRGFFAEIRKIIAFLPHEKELSFEIKVAKIEKKVDNKLTFREIVNILNEALEKRAKEQHKKSIAFLAAFNNAIKDLSLNIEKLTRHLKKRMSVLRFYMIQQWSKEINFQDPPDSVIEDSDQFTEYYKNHYNEWMSWLKAKQFFTWDDSLEFHEFLMKKIPNETFNEKKPLLLEEDKKLVEILKEKKEEIIQSITDKFIKVFIQRPELIDEAVKLCQSVFQCKTPLESSKKLRKMLKEIIFVSQTEVKEDAGENEFTPLRLLVIIRANPTNLFSKLTYMSHFLYSLMEEPSQVEVLTICEALCGHFREIIANFSEQPQSQSESTSTATK